MPTKEKQPQEILSLRESAKNQLLQIRTIEDGITYLNKLKSIDVWVKAEKKDAELQNIVAEQKLRTQRILGELIQESQRKGILKTQATAKSSSIQELDDIGLTKKQSATFQAIAEIPQDKFEEFIAEKKQAVDNAVNELTTAGALRLAKHLQESTADQGQQEQFNLEVNPEDEIKELADHINKRFEREQRELLISLIKL